MGSETLKIEEESNIPKYIQIIQNVKQAVEDKKLIRGDSLPSLNEMRKRYKVSVNTAVKAYEHLKKLGLIDSVNGKGYYVASELTNTAITVFLLFDELNLFKQDLYNSFKDALGENVKVDIFFHHYNFELYESLILDHIGHYGMFVIIPTPDPSAERVLEKLEPKQVLVLDQKHNVSDRYSSVVQDFSGEVYESLQQGVDLLGNYQSLSLIKPRPNVNADLPVFTDLRIQGLKRFCDDYSFECEIENDFDFSTIRPGRVYFIISDDDLVEIIKAVKAKHLKIGSDIGIISFNDNKLKEVIEGGITTISTDFKKMGQLAAQCVLGKTEIHKINPASLIVRSSL